MMSTARAKARESKTLPPPAAAVAAPFWRCPHRYGAAGGFKCVQIADGCYRVARVRLTGPHGAARQLQEQLKHHCCSKAVSIGAKFSTEGE